MKNQISKALSLLFITAMMLTMFTGCAVVGGIFKAGYWVGILTVALVLGVILYVTLRVSNSGTEHKG